jgi:hypothetical protein
MQSMWACNKLRLKDALAYDREVLVYDAMCVPNNQEVYEDFVEPETWAIVSTKMMFNVKGSVSYSMMTSSIHCTRKINLCCIGFTF